LERGGHIVNTTFFKRLSQLKRSLSLSAIFLLACSFFVAVLLSLSVQPHSLFDLLIPAKVELQNSNKQTVYTQNVRLNALVMPDELSLAHGQYALYVNGTYKDTLKVTGPVTGIESNNQATHQQPRDQTQTQATPAKVEVKNMDGVQAITWNETSSQLFTFSLSDNPTMKALSKHFALLLKQQKVFWSQVNEAYFASAILLALALITFHVTALASTTVQTNENWLQYLQRGWRYLPYTMVSAIIWSVALVGASIPLVGLLNTLDFPYRGNAETGIMALVTAFILVRVSSVVTGAIRTSVALLYTLSAGLIAAVLAFFSMLPAAFMALLVLVTPAVIGNMGSGVRPVETLSGTIVDLKESDTETHEAWRETLL